MISSVSLVCSSGIISCFFFAGRPSSILKLNKAEIDLQNNQLGTIFDEKIKCGAVEIVIHVCT